MNSPKGRAAPRTPQACERCRRSKTKCNGVRPRCRNCLKRNLTCVWPKTAAPGSYHILTSPKKSPWTPPQQIQTNETALDFHSDLKNPFDLPEPHLLQRLLDIFYARHLHAELCSFFHKPSLDLPTLNIRSPLLVASIISLSALYVSTEEAKADYGYETPLAMSDFYSRLAKSYASALYDEPSINSIQAFLIMAVRELLTWSHVKAFMYAGTAMKMSQALQLDLEINQKHPPRLKEIRRRTFWACVIVDRVVTYSCNQPPTACPGTHFTPVSLPCSENAFSFDDDSRGPSVDNLASYTNLVSQTGVMPFFIAMVRLWGNMAALHTSGGRRRTKHPPHHPESDFCRHDKAIEEFAANLPPSLRWSVQNYRLHQVTGEAQVYINLNLLLHHARCVMHREYLPQLDTQYALSAGSKDPSVCDAAGVSLDMNDADITKPCIEAVNIITDITMTLSSGSEQDRQLLQSIFAANAIVTAAAVHLWILYTQTCYACPKHVALANAEKLRQIIKSWQPQWRVATAWAETLEMLYKLYVYSYGKVVESDLDCWDMGLDDINENPEPSQELEGANSGNLALGDGSSMPEASEAYQRLHDKIRSILVNPLLATDVKKRNMRACCRTLWQHMWVPESLDGISSDILGLQDFMQPGLTLFNFLDWDSSNGSY